MPSFLRALLALALQPAAATSSPSGTTCAQVLASACLDKVRTTAGVLRCDACAGTNQARLRSAGCSASEVQAWCNSTPTSPTPSPRVSTTKHIDWYCGECGAEFIGFGPGAQPGLVDGIMPCCGGGCHPNGGPCWGLSINCTSGQIDVSRHNLSAYAPFLRAGKTVNVDLSGEAACCASTADGASQVVSPDVSLQKKAFLCSAE